MPIEGLTTQPITNITEAQPIVARIYKGAKKTDPKRPGEELSYFRIAVEPQFRQYEPMIKQIFGAEPTELRGMYLGGKTTNTAFTAFYREWNATGLVRECTGKYQTRAFDPNHGRVVESGQPCLRNAKKECGCKEEANFNFICPAFTDTSKIMGVFRFTTHSVIDIGFMYKALSGIQILYGTLFGVPLVLSRVLEEVAYPDPKTKQRKTAKHHFVKIRVDEDFVKANLATQLTAGAIAPQLSVPMSPVPVVSAVSADDEYYLPEDEYIEEAPKTPTWIATNGNLGKVLSWAQRFNLQENEVFDALHWDDLTINDIRDYTGNANRVRGAIIAYASGWEAEKIQTYCENPTLVFANDAKEVKAVADEIVMKVAQQMGADYIPDEETRIIIASD